VGRIRLVAKGERFARSGGGTATRRLRRIAAPLAVTSLASFAVLAQPAGSPLQIIEQRALGFGLIAAGGTSGAVTVTTAGTATCGPHTCLGGHAEARFRVRGGSSEVYDLSYSSGDTLDRTGGGGSVPLQNLADDVGGILTLNNGGQGRFRVGGEIVLGPTTPGGDYSGTYTIFFTLQ
jgi:hypothetical protein